MKLGSHRIAHRQSLPLQLSIERTVLGSHTLRNRDPTLIKVERINLAKRREHRAQLKADKLVGVLAQFRVRSEQFIVRLAGQPE